MIVVGVDGSPGAKAALRWALGEARLRGTPLCIVHAWNIAYAAAYGIALTIDPEFINELRAQASRVIDEMLAEAGSEADGVKVEKAVAKGVPAQVLVEKAEGADLLVVGSRGLGGFRGLLLGSVSQQCAHHAPCPVVIVPSPHQR
jgi:nucleotide-binding universal stress UspA family protein